MAEEIINRIANSALITINLEDFYISKPRKVLDIKAWLYEELILREKDFRSHVSNHDWSQYSNSFVALTCSSDAIIPSWAYMLITAQLSNYASEVVVGDLNLLETVIFHKIISDIDVSVYTNKPVIIKGCSNKPIPESAYIFLITKLQPVVKSLMFGEACSTVPLFKKKL